MYKTVLFDLDGTITDSEPGIIACVQHALRQFGIEVEDPKTLRPFIGPPLRDSFRDYFHMTPEEAGNRLQEITREDVCRVARLTHLDSTYLLQPAGKEAAV